MFKVLTGFSPFRVQIYYPLGVCDLYFCNLPNSSLAETLSYFILVLLDAGESEISCLTPGDGVEAGVWQRIFAHAPARTLAYPVTRSPSPIGVDWRGFGF